MSEKNLSSQSSRSMQPTTHKITVTAMLSAVAFILMYLELPVLFMPSFIKFDFSDLPELLAAFSLGPLYGVIVCFIKNAVHLAVSNSSMIGELCNFLLGVCFILPAGLFYQKMKSRTGAFLGSFIGAIAMAVLSLPINYYIVYPAYSLFFSTDKIVAMYHDILPSMHSLLQCLLVFNVPFTFLKGMLNVAVTFLIYKKLSPVLHR